MPLELGHIELRGPEVLLRPLEHGDAQALLAASAESRTTYALTSVPNGLGEVHSYLDKALDERARGQRYPFAIEWGGRVVGTTSYFDFELWQWPAGCVLQRQGVPDVAEVGYTWLAASAQRTSCNTEAKFLLFEHAFETWKVHRLCLRTDERNERSRRAIERLGCKFEGIRRGDLPGADCTVRNSA